jgi:hypothetical protein
MKVYGGVEVKFLTFLVSVIDEYQWLATWSLHFTPKKDK